MKLDYNPDRKLFALYVERGDPFDAPTLMTEYGLHHSEPASDFKTTCLFTATPYAAVSFRKWATPAALAELGWIAREVEASRATHGTGHYDVPRDLLDEGTDLWDYQKADLDYMLSRERVLDADEPGLGKTPTAIVYANMIQAQRTLVICPANIRGQWLTKFTEWSTMGETYQPDPSILDVNGNPIVYGVYAAKRGIHPNAALTVISYDLARTKGVIEALRQTQYDLLICDEAHSLKTITSKRSRAVFGGGEDELYHEALADQAKRVVMLTGTPLPNRPREAYNLARHLDFGSIDYLSEDRFNDRFNPIEEREVMRRLPDGRMVPAIIKDEKSGRHDELQNRMRAHFMTRHLKREVLKQLKYPVYELVRLDETAAIKRALKAESLLQIDPEMVETGHIDPGQLGHIATARRLMGEAMAPSVAAYIETLLEGGEEKITLFYHHIEVGNILQGLLRQYGVCRVDGNTGALAKDALVAEFQSNPAKRIMMGNLLSLGTGTDGLQHVCFHAIVCEPDWVPGNNIQAFDRLDRGGQKQLVQGDICVAPGSLAEKILASALRKLHTTHNALDRRIA